MPEQFYDAATYQARDSVGYLVRRLYSIMRTRLEAAFAHHGLTLMQWIVLMHVRDGLARTASDIAREFSHDTGALTRVIDQLEKRGLLRRRRSARDRRVVELELTRAAERLIADCLPPVFTEMNYALAPLDRAEFDQLRSLLNRVLEHLQQTALPMEQPVAPTAPGGRKTPPRRTRAGATSRTATGPRR
jgi:DNA-binding MarR family transcriptional regulator